MLKNYKKLTKKKIIFTLFITLLLAVVSYFFGFLNTSKTALPYQSCGGSMVNAKKCSFEYICKQVFFSECDGCVGVCIPK